MAAVVPSFASPADAASSSAVAAAAWAPLRSAANATPTWSRTELDVDDALAAPAFESPSLVGGAGGSRNSSVTRRNAASCAGACGEANEALKTSSGVSARRK